TRARTLRLASRFVGASVCDGSRCPCRQVTEARWEGGRVIMPGSPDPGRRVVREPCGAGSGADVERLRVEGQAGEARVVRDRQAEERVAGGRDRDRGRE